MKDLLISTEETCKLLGISKQTLNDWRGNKRVLPFYKSKGKVYYNIKDIYNAFIKNTVKVRD